MLMNWETTSISKEHHATITNVPASRGMENVTWKTVLTMVMNMTFFNHLYIQVMVEIQIPL